MRSARLTAESTCSETSTSGTHEVTAATHDFTWHESDQGRASTTSNKVARAHTDTHRHAPRRAQTPRARVAREPRQAHGGGPRSITKHHAPLPRGAALPEPTRGHIPSHGATRATELPTKQGHHAPVCRRGGFSAPRRRLRHRSASTRRVRASAERPPPSSSSRGEREELEAHNGHHAASTAPSNPLNGRRHAERASA